LISRQPEYSTHLLALGSTILTSSAPIHAHPTTVSLEDRQFARRPGVSYDGAHRTPLPTSLRLRRTSPPEGRRVRGGRGVAPGGVRCGERVAVGGGYEGDGCGEAAAPPSQVENLCHRERRVAGGKPMGAQRCAPTHGARLAGTGVPALQRTAMARLSVGGGGWVAAGMPLPRKGERPGTAGERSRGRPGQEASSCRRENGRRPEGRRALLG